MNTLILFALLCLIVHTANGASPPTHKPTKAPTRTPTRKPTLLPTLLPTR